MPKKQVLFFLGFQKRIDSLYQNTFGRERFYVQNDRSRRGFSSWILRSRQRWSGTGASIRREDSFFSGSGTERGGQRWKIEGVSGYPESGGRLFCVRVFKRLFDENTSGEK
jgi:hypothetical protein